MVHRGPLDTSRLNKSLLPSLEIVERAAKKAKQPISAAQCESLAFQLDCAVWAYFGAQFGSEFIANAQRQSTLHKMAKQLALVIDNLEHKSNIDGILIALGAPPMLSLSPDQESWHRAVAQYQNLLRDLRKITANLPPAPAKRSRGRRRALDLYLLVDRLADCWESWTGEDFKRDWQNRQPVTEAMRFTYEVISVIDRSRLKELPTVTKNIVAKRRKLRRTASTK
jgi:hypothetical protein